MKKKKKKMMLIQLTTMKTTIELLAKERFSLMMQERATLSEKH
jgi:hypothetical protein